MTSLVPVMVVSTVLLLAWLRRPAVVQPHRRAALAPAVAEFDGEPVERAGVPAWVEHGLRELHLDVAPTTVWLVLRCGAGLAVLATATWLGPVAAIAVGAILAGAPTAAKRSLTAASAARREAQLPAAMERVAAAVRSGQTLSQALASTAGTAPEPLGSELRGVSSEVAHGEGLGAAIARWGRRARAGPQTQLAARSLCLAADAGGEVARSIDRVAATLRSRREVQAEARALATQARASAGVLAVAPLAFTAGVATIEPAVVGFLLTSWIGLGCLAAGVLLELVGALWMAKILRSAA